MSAGAIGVQRSGHAGRDTIFAPDRGTAGLNRLFDTFGPPTQTLPYRPESYLSSAGTSFIDVYEGRVEYLETQFAAAIQSTLNAWINRRILVPKFHTDPVVSYQYKHFPRELPSAAASRGGFNKVRFEKRSATAEMILFNLGWEVNDDILMTSEGQQIARGHHKNAQLGFIELMQQMTIEKVIDIKNVHADYSRRMHGKLSDPAGIIANSIKYTGILNKEVHGAEQLVDYARNVVPNYQLTDIILDEGIASLFAMQPEHLEAYRAGTAEASATRLAGADYVGPAMVGGLYKNVFRAFRGPDDTLYNPLLTMVREGSWFASIDRDDPCAFAYSRDARSITLLDLTSGSGEERTLNVHYLLRGCNRWTNDGPDGRGRLLPLHYELAQQLNEERLGERALTDQDRALFDAGRADPLLYRDQHNEYHVAEYIGQKEKWAFSADAMRNTSCTLEQAVLRQIGSTHAAALDAGALLIERRYPSRLPDNAADAFLETVLASGIDPATRVQRGNAVGGPAELGAADLATLAQGRLPTGLASVPGLRTAALFYTSATPAGSDVDVAQAFDAAVVALVEAARSMLADDHPLLDGRYVPAHFASGSADAADAAYQNSVTVFAQNTIDHNKTALLYTGGEAAAFAPGQFGVDNASATSPIRNPADAAAARRVGEIVFPIAPPSLRKVFSSRVEFGKFSETFAQSALAAAYLDAWDSRASKPEQLQFAKFLRVHFGPIINERYPANVAGQGTTAEERRFRRSLTSALQRTVLTVQEGRAIDNVRATLEAWLEAEADDDVEGVEIDVPESTITRIVVPYKAYISAPLNDRLGFAFASPGNPAVALSNDEERVASAAGAAVRSIERSFLQARAHAGGDSERAVAPYGGAHSAPFEARQAFELPSFAPDLLVEVGSDARMHLCQNLAERYNRVAQRERNALRRTVAFAVLLAPTCRQTYERLADASAVVPLDFIIHRPDETYEMSRVVFASGGPDLGELAYGFPSITFGSDAITGANTCKMQMRLAPIVYDEARLFIPPPVAYRRYVSGGGIGAHTPETYAASLDDPEMAALSSLIICAVSYGSVSPAGGESGDSAGGHGGGDVSITTSCGVPATHDISGHFSSAFTGSYLTSEAERYLRRAHFDAWRFTAALFGLAQRADFDGSPFAYDGYTGDVTMPNRIVHRGWQLSYDPATRRVSHPTLDTGHRGPHGSYAGVGRDMSTGVSRFMPPMLQHA